jgi:Leucine-rich repeat (LRR) protein
MPKTITDLPPAAEVRRNSVVAVDNAAATITEKVTLGAIADLSQPPPQNPPSMARMVTVRSSGSFSSSVKSTTGYVAVRWWDGSVDVYGAGSPTASTTVSKAIPTTGNWSKSAPKEIFVWSCTIGNAEQSGDLTYLSSSSNQLTSVDLSGLTSLAYLYLDNNQLASVDLSGLPSLTSLTLSNNQITSVDLSGLPSLTSLTLSNNQITGSLDLTGLTSLASLNLTSNQLTSIDLSGLTLLSSLYLGNNQLTSVRAVGFGPNAGGPGTRIQLLNNLLDGPALDQFYTDLGAPGTEGIDVTGNPGTSSDDPTIATAKGYPVIGS